MSLPLTRSDDYKPKNDDDDREMNESRFPWVVHGSFCYTEQKANANGNNPGGPLLKKPAMHYWCGSTKAAARLEKINGSSLKGLDKFYHTDFDAYMDAFLVSEEEQGKKKAKPKKRAATAATAVTVKKEGGPKLTKRNGQQVLQF